jgi:transcriptional regulator with XRE-family HTH domain
MTLGETIQLLRKRRGLTKQELARRIEVHQTIIGRWESGQTQPRTKALERMAEIFGLTVEQLLAGDYVGVSNVIQDADDPELVDMLAQIKKLNTKEREALKTVLSAMLSRAQMAEVVARSA